MSPEDYEKLIAEVISKHLRIDGSLSARCSLGLLAIDIADRLARLKPEFDRKQFLKACDVEG
jgi:hypothetical protein